MIKIMNLNRNMEEKQIFPFTSETTIDEEHNPISAKDRKY